MAPANFIDWRSQSQSSRNMGAAEYWTPNLTGTDNPENCGRCTLRPTFFRCWVFNRCWDAVFLPEEQDAGKEHEVVLSYSLWQGHFAGNTEIIGRSVALSGETYTVVGVMPRIQVRALLGDEGGTVGAAGIGFAAHRPRWRFAPRICPAEAWGHSGAGPGRDGGITGRLEREFPGTNQDMQVLSLREKVVGNIRPALLVLTRSRGLRAADCLRQRSHMLLARAAARREEIALRTALGAGRWDMFHQFLTESMAPGFIGWRRRFAACNMGRSRSAGHQSGWHTQSGNRRCGWLRAAVCIRHLLTDRPGFRHSSGLESDRGQPQ